MKSSGIGRWQKVWLSPACLIRRGYRAGGNPARIVIAGRWRLRYIGGMNWLTKPEQLVLGVIVGLLLVGGAVKTYRAAHPPTPVMVQSARP